MLTKLAALGHQCPRREARKNRAGRHDRRDNNVGIEVEHRVHEWAQIAAHEEASRVEDDELVVHIWQKRRRVQCQAKKKQDDEMNEKKIT